MKKSVDLPYGREKLTLELEDHEVYAILKSRIDELRTLRDQSSIVGDAMASPIGSPRLNELSLGKKTATIIVSDHTRPVPSRHIIPQMLSELRQGNPTIDITLLVATGFHRGTTKAELKDKLGEEIVEKEKIESNQ